MRAVIAALLTIGIGLLVHRGALPLTPRTRDVLGDALWASMMVWWMGVVWPAKTPMVRGGLALAVCVLVESSQLLHVSWLDAVRATSIGHLVLGSGFDARDLLAYTIGCGVAVAIDMRWLSRAEERSGT